MPDLIRHPVIYLDSGLRRNDDIGYLIAGVITVHYSLFTVLALRETIAFLRGLAQRRRLRRVWRSGGNAFSGTRRLNNLSRY